jgi:hypothetical protein
LQVLIQNHFYREKISPKGLTCSFWSSSAYFIDSTFSINSTLNQEDSIGPSPYFIVDAKIALLISLLKVGKNTYVRGIGSMGTVAAISQTQSEVHNIEDEIEIAKYKEEYFPKTKLPLIKTDFYGQVVTLNETTIDRELWAKLAIDGIYILGGSISEIQIDLMPKQFEAIGNFWPIGEATEHGWCFKNLNELGLTNFEFFRLRKLS